MSICSDLKLAVKDARFRGGRGFTIVELIIAVVVIAILAAISIVAYTGIQNRANDSVVQADLQSSLKQIMIFKTRNGRYPSSSNYDTNPQVQAEINKTITATRGSYWTTSNAYIYCKSDDAAAVVGRSKSGVGFYASTKGNGRFTNWPGDGNANLCPAAGVPTSSTDYGNVWLYSGGGSTPLSWRPWFTGR